MIKSKADLLFYIREDRFRNLGKYEMGLCEYLAKYLYGTDNIKAYRYLKVLRKYEYAKNCLYHKGIIGKFVTAYWKYRHHRLSEKYNVVIGPNMVGYGFRMPHILGGGIVVNCKSMGNYCGANIGVLVGNNKTLYDRPTIGDNVGLTTGCKIYGDIHVGNNVTVAPNSVVITDVPDNAIVSGVPAKIIAIKEK
jgi:serine O-acetyltransferase